MPHKRHHKTLNSNKSGLNKSENKTFKFGSFLFGYPF